MAQAAGGEVNLRPYQVAAIDGARAHVRAGKRAPLIVLPTGAGKTVTARAIVQSHVERGGRVAWGCHRRELVQQAADTLNRFVPSVGYLGANASARVQIFTVQSALSRGEAPPGTLVVLDEAHHFVADEWKALPEVYRDAIVVGLTATPMRADGRGLGSVFDSLVVATQIKDLIAAGHLVLPRLLSPKAPVGKKLALSPVDAYRRHGNGQSAVVFARTVDEAEDYAEDFRKAGIRAAAVSERTPTEERDRVLADFADGVIRVLCNVMVLTEGWDCPRAKVLIYARELGSVIMLLQTAGRVMRPWRGEPATILDLTGSVLDKFGRIDQEWLYSLEDGETAIRGASWTLEGGLCARHSNPRPCAACAQVAAVLGIANVDLVEKWSSSLNASERDAKEGPEQKAKWLAWKMKQEAINKYKPRWAMVQYRVKYGKWPERWMVDQARALNRGAA